jgi:hypothetical protein
MAREFADFVDIELTPAAAAVVGDGGALRIATQHIDYTFTPGKSVRVLSSEWTRVLSRESLGGELLLQVAQNETKKKLSKKAQESEAPAEGE